MEERDTLPWTVYQTTQVPMLPIVDFSGTIIKLLPILYDSCRIGMSAKAESSIEASERRRLAWSQALGQPPPRWRGWQNLPQTEEAVDPTGASEGCTCFFLSALLDFHHFGSRSGGAVFNLPALRRAEHLIVKHAARRRGVLSCLFSARLGLSHRRVELDIRLNLQVLKPQVKSCPEAA